MPGRTPHPTLAPQALAPSQLLSSLGRSASKRLGQNFLASPTAVHHIIEALGIQPGDAVIEVGAGLGVLTGFLAAAATSVVAVEVDPDLVRHLRATFADCATVRVVQDDILRCSATALLGDAAGPYRVAGNLPYYITSAVLRHVLDWQPAARCVVVMVQYEVARRIVAGPGEMSLLALMVQIKGVPRVVARVPAGAFVPAPKVNSAVVSIAPHAEPLGPPALVDEMFRLARMAFQQGRKMLANPLSAGLGLPKSEVLGMLEAAGIPATSRPEELRRVAVADAGPAHRREGVTQSRDYAVLNYARRRPPLAELTELTGRAFAEYPGVIVADEPFISWYLARPGFDSVLSQAVWNGEALAGGLFVTRAHLWLAGGWREVGIIDTVMTAPEHRRAGLARRALEAALDAASQAGLCAMQLYTGPGSPGFHLYESLGFRTVAELRYWRAPCLEHGAPDSSWSVAGLSALNLLDPLLGTHEGVPRVDMATWRWRKENRPASMPATVWLQAGGRAGVSATAVPVCLTDGSKVTLLNDMVGIGAPSLTALVPHLPDGADVVALADKRDARAVAALRDAGLSPAQAEVAMLLPLTHAGAPLPAAGRPWFPLSESVIGA